MLEAKDVAIKNQGEDSCFTLEAPSLLFPDRGPFLLLGDSGSGKTTLLEALQGLRPLARGKILAEGEEKTSFNPSETTYCPAGGLAVPSLSVRDNLRLVTGDMGEGERILKELHFPESYRKKKASKLSVGERARLSLAMAILSPGKALFLDEPTANLDKENAGRAFALLQEESRRRLVIVAANLVDIPECDGKVEVRDGKVPPFEGKASVERGEPLERKKPRRTGPLLRFGLHKAFRKGFLAAFSLLLSVASASLFFVGGGLLGVDGPGTILGELEGRFDEDYVFLRSEDGSSRAGIRVETPGGSYRMLPSEDLEEEGFEIPEPSYVPEAEDEIPVLLPEGEAPSLSLGDPWVKEYGVSDVSFVFAGRLPDSYPFDYPVLPRVGARRAQKALPYDPGLLEDGRTLYSMDSLDGVPVVSEEEEAVELIEDGADMVIQLALGRMPEKENECLVQQERYDYRVIHDSFPGFEALVAVGKIRLFAGPDEYSSSVHEVNLFGAIVLPERMEKTSSYMEEHGLYSLSRESFLPSSSFGREEAALLYKESLEISDGIRMQDEFNEFVRMLRNVPAGARFYLALGGSLFALSFLTLGLYLLYLGGSLRDGEDVLLLLGIRRRERFLLNYVPFLPFLVLPPLLGLIPFPIILSFLVLPSYGAGYFGATILWSPLYAILLALGIALLLMAILLPYAWCCSRKKLVLERRRA